MKWSKNAVMITVVGMLFPVLAKAQAPQQAAGLHQVLENLYDEMMPLCGQLIGVGQGIAGFAALWYIGSRIWKHLANAEPIDFYPLLRPFAIGLCIMLFPAVIAVINGVLKPVATGTASMVEGSNKAIELLLKQKEEALKKTSKWQMYVGPDGSGDRQRWYKYTYGDQDEGMLDGIGNDIQFAAEKMAYNFRNSVKEWMSEILQLLFEAASLCINTLRTFQLLILAILGPLVFGLSVFDGFQHTLTVWLSRYINIFLWLPVANIFGAVIAKIQENMVKLDIRQIESAGDTFFSSTDIGYLIFMLIGIVGYFTVPSVANYIVHAAGGGALQQKITGMVSSTTGGMTSRAGDGAGNLMNSPGYFREGLSGQAQGEGVAGAIGRSLGRGAGYMYDKISGSDQ